MKSLLMESSFLNGSKTKAGQVSPVFRRLAQEEYLLARDQQQTELRLQSLRATTMSQVHIQVSAEES